MSKKIIKSSIKSITLNLCKHNFREVENNFNTVMSDYSITSDQTIAILYCTKCAKIVNITKED